MPRLTRLGRFSISRPFMELYPSEVQCVFRHVLVIQAQQDYERDAIDYLAYSDHFQELEPGILAPEYWVVHEKGSGGKVRFQYVGYR